MYVLQLLKYCCLSNFLTKLYFRIIVLISVDCFPQALHPFSTVASLEENG